MGLLALCLLGGTRRLMLLIAAMVPFGMFAVISLPSVGGLSLLAVNIATAATVGIGCIMLVGRLVRGAPLRIAPASLAILIFAAYTIFSATVLVRLFAGDMMVFSMAPVAGSLRISTAFLWGKVWLAPGSSNISQTFYVLLASGLFVVAAAQLNRHGPEFGRRCLALAATVNIVLGCLDLAALDPLLEFVRTANYSLMSTATVKGIPRVIGGFSESAGFGTLSSVFFAFFASLTLRRGGWRNGLLAGGNFIFACLALSSTGILAIVVVSLVLSIQTRLRIQMPDTLRRGWVLSGAVALAVLALVIGAILTLTPFPTLVASVIDDLILSKSSSASGLERSAWAMGGLEAMQASYGLGVGAGSLRSNGLFFVLLGSVGIPGTLAFGAFLWLAFSGRADGDRGDILASARMGALAVMIAMMLSATVPDPGVPLVFMAALACASRRTEIAPGLLFAPPLAQPDRRTEAALYPMTNP